MTAKELMKLIEAGFTKSDLINLGFDFPATEPKQKTEPEPKPETEPEPKQETEPEPKQETEPEPKQEPGNGKTWDDIYHAITDLVSTIQAGNIVGEGVKEQPKKDEFWGLDKIINPMNGQEV